MGPLSSKLRQGRKRLPARRPPTAHDDHESVRPEAELDGTKVTGNTGASGPNWSFTAIVFTHG
jgi:hypothetical protein